MVHTNKTENVYMRDYIGLDPLKQQHVLTQRLPTLQPPAQHF